MLSDDLVLADDFCTYYDVNVGFVLSLHQMGLIEIVSLEEKPHISHDQLPRLEQLLRLHSDLSINPEGIDVVCNLLDKIRSMQVEISSLKNRLDMYENLYSELMEK